VDSGIETLPYYSLVQLSARRHKVAVQHVVGARAVGRHPRAMHHLRAAPGQDEAQHDRAVWAQRRQVKDPPLRLPRVLLHKTTKTMIPIYLMRAALAFRSQVAQFAKPCISTIVRGAIEDFTIHQQQKLCDKLAF
jgi:hypothetical protein